MVQCSNFRIILSVTVTGLLQTISCVQIVSLYVPRGASHEAPMDCRYDLEGGTLYDVKWYKDGEQFYRCAGNGSVQEFSVEGVKIYHSNLATIGSCPLTVTSLTPKSAGQYTCEVSLDGPSFHIVTQSAKLRIIESSRRIQNKSSDSTEDNETNSSAENRITNSGSKGKEDIIINFIILFILICNI